jgi:hypothetical protein
MARIPTLLLLTLPALLALQGCYADQKSQLVSCEASATRTGPGQPLRSIQSCMDNAGYRFVGYANPGGLTIDCDLPAVIRGEASALGTDAQCFEPKGALALKIYRIQVPVKNPS